LFTECLQITIAPLASCLIYSYALIEYIIVLPLIEWLPYVVFHDVTFREIRVDTIVLRRNVSVITCAIYCITEASNITPPT